jgi:hypothetical protein
VDEASLRVSDAEREQAVISLRDHLLAGRLTLDEFSDRVEAALGARVRGELARVLEDLPGISRPRRRPTRFTAALCGHVTRRGRLRLGRWTCAAAACGDLDFDLRDAAIGHPSTTVMVLAAFGNVDVYVPEGVNVDAGGITIFGHRRDWGPDVGRPDAPTVHVRALGCFATVDVWRVPRDLHGGYSEIFREIERRQRRLRHQNG